MRAVGPFLAGVEACPPRPSATSSSEVVPFSVTPMTPSGAFTPGNAPPAIAPPSSSTSHGRDAPVAEHADRLDRRGAADLLVAAERQPDVLGGRVPGLEQATRRPRRSAATQPLSSSVPRPQIAGPWAIVDLAAERVVLPRAPRRRPARRRGGPSARPAARRSRRPSGRAGRGCRHASAPAARAAAGTASPARPAAGRRPRCRRARGRGRRRSGCGRAPAGRRPRGRSWADRRASRRSMRALSPRAHGGVTCGPESPPRQPGRPGHRNRRRPPWPAPESSPPSRRPSRPAAATRPATTGAAGVVGAVATAAGRARAPAERHLLHHHDGWVAPPRAAHPSRSSARPP